MFTSIYLNLEIWDVYAEKKLKNIVKWKRNSIPKWNLGELFYNALINNLYEILK